jgi:hypothetical protein
MDHWREHLEYDPTQPGSIDLPRQVPLPASRCTMDADTLAGLAAAKAADIERNTRALEKAYVKHQHVLIRFDRLIRSIERIATTPELRDLVLDLRARRATTERLLFTGGSELRRDESTTQLP